MSTPWTNPDWEGLQEAGSIADAVPAQTEPTVGPPALRHGEIDILIGGSAGEVGIRRQELAYRDNYRVAQLYIDNDRNAPATRRVVGPGGEVVEVVPEPRCVIASEDNPRDVIKAYPLLKDRYLDGRMLRDVPAYVDYARGGRSYPVIASMLYDLGITPFIEALSRALAVVRNAGEPVEGETDLQQILRGESQRQEVIARQWIIWIVFGGAGATGVAGGQKIPHLVQHILSAWDVRNYEIRGIVLGPYAYTGLHPRTIENYFGLMHSLQYMTLHGQHLDYIDGLKIDRDTAPFRWLIPLDERPIISGGRVTEAQLEAFYSRAARTFDRLASGAWDEVATVASNPDNLRPEGGQQDERLRWLATANAAIAGVNLPALEATLAARIEASLARELVDRLAA